MFYARNMQKLTTTRKAEEKKLTKIK